MAASSSISTYLDVTKAAEASPESSEQTASVPVDQAAKILAAVHSGTELVTELPEKTGLDPAQVLALVGRMADSGLVTVVQEDSGALHVHLTDSTQQALSAA